MPGQNEIANSIEKQRVLIVEDEARLLEHLSEIFTAEGLSIFTCSSYKDLEKMLDILPTRFDIIVLDRLLHGHDSAQLMPKFKSLLPTTRIMILSAINTPSEKALLLDLGADDYVAKPFDGEELVARVRALLRRSTNILKFGNVSLEVSSRTMTVAGVDVPVANKEFLFLRTLIENPGKLFNKAFLYQRVWEMSPDVDSNVIETTVNKLRRRLSEAGASIRITNARNVGYWIEE